MALPVDHLNGIRLQCRPLVSKYTVHGGYKLLYKCSGGWILFRGVTLFRGLYAVLGGYILFRGLYVVQGGYMLFRGLYDVQ